MKKLFLFLFFTTVLTQVKSEEYLLNYVVGSGDSMLPTLSEKPTYYKVRKVAFKDLKIGDIPLYHNYMYYDRISGNNYWTSHTITGKDLMGNYIVKGDNCLTPDFVKVTPANYGGVVLVVPKHKRLDKVEQNR